MSAIACSGIVLESLNIYSETSRCSVPTFDIFSHVPQLLEEGLARSASSIRNLSISMSTKVQTNIEKVVAARQQLQGPAAAYHGLFGSSTGLLSAEDPQAIEGPNFPGPAQLLGQMHNLETLDLHLFQTLKGSIQCYDAIFSHIARDVRLPYLRQCRLRGLRAQEHSLLAFLDNHDQIQSLELGSFQLTTGASYDLVFARLSRMPNMTSLTLCNLFHPHTNSVVNLKPRHGTWPRHKMCEFPCLRGRKVYKRHFDRTAIEHGFELEQRDLSRQMGSPDFTNWLRQRERLYGHPN